ncbi:RNA-dependent RNA polymerase [Scophthalmus maximus rhabdovirus]|uniref:RNA-directed RNA polymerase L n=1 Tax=Scophthalmus maximus rhabdovirus TaxID=936149 RepID=E7D0U6_9RHAB|nr:RNA-dependent RNA polymerase [Scophthalmus maximus rhabdovirus]ADU05406.1 RNA-dependent RNA polymerase [Scophthalmus maximus rhabdovirus]
MDGTEEIKDSVPLWMETDELESEEKQEWMEFINNVDYNLNSPLIRDEVDSFVKYLNTDNLESRFARFRQWKIDKKCIKELLPSAPRWVGSSGSQRIWSYLCKSNTSARKYSHILLKQTQRESNEISGIQQAFFKGWIGKDIGPVEKKHPVEVTKWLEIFLEFHIMVLMLNAKSKSERDNLCTTFGFALSEDRRSAGWDSQFLGPIIITGSWILIVNRHTVMERNYALMIKDTCVGRFMTLSSMIGRFDEMFTDEHLRSVLHFYALGDEYVSLNGNEAYSGIKLVEPMCNDRLAELAAEFRPLIPKFTNFTEHVRTAVEEAADPGGHLHMLHGLIKRETDVNLLLIYYGSFRHWGHPYVEYAEGMEKLHRQVTMKKDVDDKMAQCLASDLAYMVLKKQFDSKRKWMVNKEALPDKHPFKEHIADSAWPTPAQIEQFGDNWHKLPIIRCFEVPDMIDPSQIYSDKSHSMQRSEVIAHILEKPNEPIPTRKVLETFLNKPATNWPEFLQNINDNGLPWESLVIGLKPKERELKLVGRFFSLMSWELREYFVVTEYLIKKHFVPLFKGLAMADDLTEVIKKMLDSAYGQGLDDYSAVCIANHIDYEKWNNHQRKESNRYVFRVMGQCLGYPNLIERTHEFFENSLVYLNMRPDEMVVDGRHVRPRGDMMSCWEGQAGGLEGLRQKGWSILNLLLIRRISKIRNTKIKILAQGDNQVICTQYKLPSTRNEKETVDAIKGMVQNNNAIMESIEEGTKKLGLLINQDETVQCADYMNYGKVPIFRGNIRGLETKRWSRVTCVTNDQLPTFANVMSSVSTNALTVSHFATSPIDPIRHFLYYGTFARILLELHNPAMRGRHVDIIRDRRFDPSQSEYKACCLYLDPSLGGISGTSLTRFLMRMFPDPVTESLTFWKIVHDNTEVPWIRKLSVGAGNPRLSPGSSADLSKLIEDPTSLNIPKGISALTIMKEEVKKNLYRISHKLENHMARDAIDYSRDEEEQMMLFLSSIRPLFPRFLSEFKNATYLGITDSLIALFQNSRTIRNLFTSKYKREIDHKILKGEITSMVRLCTIERQRLGNDIWQCSASQADRLRSESWGSQVVGTTVPHPAELLGTPSLSSATCEGCLGPNDRRGYITVSVPRGLAGYLDSRGPLMAYLGSKTSETTSLLQPWERETKIPLIKRAAKLRTPISWFVQPDSNLAASIMGNLESLTGENWSNAIAGFKRTGSALHRFSCSRVSAGGYSGQSPAKLTRMVSTTDTFMAPTDDNYDFMFQSLLIHSQITVGEIHDGVKENAVYHQHISCTGCLRKIDEPYLESEWVYNFQPVHTQLSQWRGGQGGWSTASEPIVLQPADWTKMSKRLQSFHVGRSIGFMYGDLTCISSSQKDDSSLFPLSIQRKLIPEAFFEGILEGLVRAASLDLINRRSVRKLSRPYVAILGTVGYLIGELSSSAGMRNLTRKGPLSSELTTVPHKVPPSYPMTDLDLGALLRNYLQTKFRHNYDGGWQNYTSLDTRIVIFADMRSERIMGPLILSSMAMKHLFKSNITPADTEKLRLIANLSSALRDEDCPTPDLSSLSSKCYTVDSEVRHACKFFIGKQASGAKTLKWGQEVTGTIVQVKVMFSDKPSKASKLSEVAPRVQNPTISGLRQVQLATGSHYKIRSIIKEMGIKYKDFISGGDGSGGITAACLRLNQGSRCIFNSLLEYDQVTLKGSAPSPPSAVVAMGGMSERCVNLEYCWQTPSDLSQEATWDNFRKEKDDHNLSLGLIVLDMEVRDHSTASRIAQLTRDYAYLLMAPHGTLIFKTYLTVLGTFEDNPLSILAPIFSDVRLVQSQFSSSHTSEVYLVGRRSRGGVMIPASIQWDVLNLAVKKMACWRTDKEEFDRALSVSRLNHFKGIPKTLIPDVGSDLTVLMQAAGLEGGVATMVSHLLTHSPSGLKGSDVMTILAVTANAVVNITRATLTRPGPPSDQNCVSLASMITGSLIWISIWSGDFKLNQFANLLISTTFPLFWNTWEVKDKKGNKLWKEGWSVKKGLINKSSRLDAKMANVGHWIRTWSRLNWVPEPTFNAQDLDHKLSYFNIGLTATAVERQTGLLDLLSCQGTLASAEYHDVWSEVTPDMAWRD